jgi:hypothetical protein
MLTMLEIAGNSALIDAERLGDFGQRHALAAQFPGPLRHGLSRSFLAAFIDASLGGALRLARNAEAQPPRRDSCRMGGEFDRVSLWNGWRIGFYTFTWNLPYFSLIYVKTPRLDDNSVAKGTTSACTDSACTEDPNTNVVEEPCFNIRLYFHGLTSLVN